MSEALVLARSICCSCASFSSEVIIASSELALSRQACVGKVRPAPASTVPSAPATLPLPPAPPPSSPPAPPLPLETLPPEPVVPPLAVPPPLPPCCRAGDEQAIRTDEMERKTRLGRDIRRIYTTTGLGRRSSRSGRA